MSTPVVIPITSTRPGRSHPMPRRMTPGSTGLDLYACVDEPLEIPPKQLELIGTGYAIALPPGYEGQVRPRSGLALKHKIGVLNSPGTIDSDYRGEIKVILFNYGDQPYRVLDRERIAQLVIGAVPSVVFEEVECLDDTDRGAGGYGHTGR